MRSIAVSVVPSESATWTVKEDRPSSDGPAELDNVPLVPTLSQAGPLILLYVNVSPGSGSIAESAMESA
jgi:hypothetical protein